MKAEKEEDLEEEKEGYVRREIGRMSFCRQIRLPADANGSQAETKIEDGVLGVSVPRRCKEGESKRKLDIQ